MYKLQTLKNGIRIITIPMKGTQTFTILVMVATGSRYETKDTNGISHFLEHMFFKGTEKRPNTLTISSELDRVGGEYNAFTSKEYTGYYVKVGESSQSRRLAIDVVNDILINSKFDNREIKREKGVIIEEINMYQNNPLIHIDDLFEECLYGNTSAGWDTIGTSKNVQRFSRTDLLKYWQSQYQGQALVVGLAGNFKSSDVALTKKLFSKISSGEKNKTKRFAAVQTAPRLKIKKQKVEQINLSLGARAYSYHHNDYYAVKLLGIILGGSMSSRLFLAVRGRRGLAYQVHTQVQTYNDSGYLTTTIGTSHDKVEEAVKVILAEYRKLIRQSVGASELKKAKDYIRGKTTLHLESSDSMASWFIKQEVLDREVVIPEEYFKKIARVSADDIKRVALDIFKSENLNLAVIGRNLNERKLKQVLLDC